MFNWRNCVKLKIKLILISSINFIIFYTLLEIKLSNKNIMVYKLIWKLFLIEKIYLKWNIFGINIKLKYQNHTLFIDSNLIFFYKKFSLYLYLKIYLKEYGDDKIYKFKNT